MQSARLNARLRRKETQDFGAAQPPQRAQLLKRVIRDTPQTLITKISWCTRMQATKSQMQTNVTTSSSAFCGHRCVCWRQSGRLVFITSISSDFIFTMTQFSTQRNANPKPGIKPDKKINHEHGRRMFFS